MARRKVPLQRQVSFVVKPVSEPMKLSHFHGYGNNLNKPAYKVQGREAPLQEPGLDKSIFCVKTHEPTLRSEPSTSDSVREHSY